MKRLLLPLLGLIAFASLAKAGPPFVTDDPEPVEYQHWEVYLASQVGKDTGGWAGTSPHVEVNYGVIPNVQLHLIAPMAFDSPRGATRHMGYGDTELGVKYRFIEQTEILPSVAIFPLVELPTGDQNRGLGSGHTQVFAPVWLQKNFGKWTTYGGAGYWVNPGPDNRDWWYYGWLLQRQVTHDLALGSEVFYETAKAPGESSATFVNAGGIWDLNENVHILFSGGHSIQGPSSFQAYLALQFTFGPKRSEKAEK